MKNKIQNILLILILIFMLTFFYFIFAGIWNFNPTEIENFNIKMITTTVISTVIFTISFKFLEL